MSLVWDIDERMVTFWKTVAALAVRHAAKNGACWMVEHVPKDCRINNWMLWWEMGRHIAVVVVGIVRFRHRGPWTIRVMYNVHVFFVEESILERVRQYI